MNDSFGILVLRIRGAGDVWWTGLDLLGRCETVAFIRMTGCVCILIGEDSMGTLHTLIVAVVIGHKMTTMKEGTMFYKEVDTKSLVRWDF